MQTSWRARPGSFVSLMTLYESNFVRLGWLVERFAVDVDAHRVSRVDADCDLHLTPLELSRYTSVFRLTYEFQIGGVARARSRIWKCASITMRAWRKFAAFAAFSAIRSSPECSLDSSVNWISAGPGT